MSNASFGAPRAEGQPFAPTMDYYIPQWEERTSYGMRRIDPYTKLFEDRIIFLGTPISDEIANAVMAQLLCLQQMDADRDIEIYINSPGGSFTALTAIYDTMRYIKPDVRTVCLGQAASAAAVILAAGTKGKRLALPNSRILIHQPYTEGTFGQTSDIEIQANEILRMRELLEKMIADSSGKDIDQVSRDIERDKILTAEQAVEYGLIDAVIESRKGADPESSWTAKLLAKGPEKAAQKFGEEAVEAIVEAGIAPTAPVVSACTASAGNRPTPRIEAPNRSSETASHPYPT